MADSIETVNVEGPAQNRRPGYTGLSPLKAGLLYGGAAATVMGPLALPIGLLAGIVAKRSQDSFLDREAATVQNIQSQHQRLLDRIDAEYSSADPDEKRLLDQARDLSSDGYERLMSGDASGDQLLSQSRAIMQGIVGADSQARKADEAAAMGFQRQLIGEAAKSYRQEYQQTIGDHDTIQQRTARVFDLLSQSDVDPNKPFFKAIIGDLVTEGMGMYRDTPGAWDAISNKVGGLAGVGIDAVAGVMKSEDFKLTREDAYRVALNLRQFSDQQAQGRLSQLGDQARKLDDLARRTRSIADDYSIGDYVSGGEKELRLLPVPAPPPPTERLSTGPVSNFFRGLQKEGEKAQRELEARRGQRPVNGSR